MTPPYPPARMRASTAAAYMDVSRSKWDADVAKGVWPKPVTGPDGISYWKKEDLDNLSRLCLSKEVGNGQNISL